MSTTRKGNLGSDFLAETLGPSDDLNHDVFLKTSQSDAASVKIEAVSCSVRYTISRHHSRRLLWSPNFYANSI